MKKKEKRLPILRLRKNKLNFINDKIKLILPELMARNSKLAERLKSKLKVSTFLNNTENRNQKYLKSFVLSSDKRVKDLKTGQDLGKAVKQSSRDLHPLCSQISNDYILQNSDFLINEKKLLHENTEKETHSKIYGLIQRLKRTIKNINISPIKQEKSFIKSLSFTELNNVKSLLDSKIKDESELLNNKINGYLSKLNKVSGKNKKEFKRYIEGMDIYNNLRFINYIKSKPLRIKDEECPNMIKIKNRIFPKKTTQAKSVLKKKFLKRKSLDFNHISNNISNDFSFIDISHNINYFNKSVKDEPCKVDVMEKDTLKLINNLASQGRNLSYKINSTFNKINSLVDINLPNLKKYENVIKKNKENFPYKSQNNSKDEKEICDLSDQFLFNKNQIKNIIKMFGKEIEIIKNEKIDFHRNHEDSQVKYYNSIKAHLERIHNKTNNIQAYTDLDNM